MVDISQTDWGVNDSSNNSAAPLGAPEGMAPSGVNDTMRAMMGATKRFWTRINPTVIATNVGNAYTYTPVVAAPSLMHGEVYCFKVPATSTGHATLNVGVGGAQPIVKPTSGGTTSLSSSELIIGSFAQVAWDSVSAHWVLMNNPGLDDHINSVSIADAAGGGSTGAIITAILSELSLTVSQGLASLSAAAVKYSLSLSQHTSLLGSHTTDINALSVFAHGSLSTAELFVRGSLSTAELFVRGSLSTLETKHTSLSTAEALVHGSHSTAELFVRGSLSTLEAYARDTLSVCLAAHLTNINAVSANAASVATHVNTLSVSVSAAVTNRLPVAWCNFVGTQASISAFFGYNVASITRVAGVGGDYRIVFSNALDVSKGLSIALCGNSCVGFVVSTGATSINIQTYLWSGTLCNDPYVSAVIFGAGSM